MTVGVSMYVLSISRLSEVDMVMLAITGGQLLLITSIHQHHYHFLTTYNHYLRNTALLLLHPVSVPYS